MRLSLRTGVLALGALFVVSGLAIAAANGDTAKPVTFSKDIAPIFQAKCQTCHHPGTSAPMSLMTYEEVRPWARSIQLRVASREMPPWHLDKTVGIREYKNDRSLKDEQVVTDRALVDGGAPRRSERSAATRRS